MIKDEIRTFILKALRAADGEPVQENILRDSIRRAFPRVAYTESDLILHIQWCENRGWITGTAVELAGTVWTLTPKGTLKAAQLG